MEKSNLFTILLVTITTLLLLSVVAFAEGEWVTSGDNIYNTNSGNVGIGTTSSSAKLHVSGGDIAIDNGQSLRLQRAQAGTGYVETLTVDANDDLHIGNGNFDKVFFYGDQGLALTIDQSNRVGIGTTSPDYLLDIRNVRTKASAINAIIQVSNDISDSTTNGDQFTSAVFGGDITNAGMGYLTIEHQYHSNTPFRFSALQTHSNFAAFGDGPGSTGELTYPYLLLNPYGGNIGIGTTSPDYKLDVLGTIRAEEVKVETGWSDFVFEDNYNLPSLETVESFIKENKHLPDIPSAKEVKEQGLSVSEMMAKQMQKIEELTLYVIEQSKQIEELKEELNELKNMN